MLRARSDLTVDRTALVDRIVSSGARIVTLTAPAGYGKSRLALALGARYGTLGVIDWSDAAGAFDAASIVVRALSPFDPIAEERIGRRLLALSYGAGDLMQVLAVVRDAFESALSPGAILLDNVESVLKTPELAKIANQVVRLAKREVVIAGRERLAMPDLDQVFANDRYDVHAADLQFSLSETSALLLRAGAGAAEAQRGAQLAAGWPIAALTFARYAQENRLTTFLAEAERGRAVDVLQQYLLSQTVEHLSGPVRAVLAAIARTGAVSREELDVLTDDASTVLVEFRASPFWIEAASGLSLHPLARVVLKSDPTGIAPLRRAAVALSSSHYLRAARWYLLVGDDDAAAAIMDAHVAPFLTVQPTPETAALVAEIRPDVLVRHHATWCSTLMYRAYAVSSHQWLNEARTAYATLPRDVSPELYFGVAIILLNFLIVSGLYAEADDALAEVSLRLPDDDVKSAYARVLRLWRRYLELRRGRAVDFEVLWEDAEPVIGAVPSSVTQFLISFTGPSCFLQDRRDDSRCAFDRAIELSTGPGSEMSLLLALKNAAFHAWLAGEDELFRSLVDRLADIDEPNVLRGIRHFIGCARGAAPADTPTGFEMLYTRVFGALIAASREPERDRRMRALRVAEDAAREDGQPWPFALVMLAIGLSNPDRRSEAFAAARAAAGECGYPAFRENVAAVLEGRMPAGWCGLRPFVVSRRGLTIRFGSRTVLVDGRIVTLAQREMELLLALALAGAPRDRSTLGAMIWPDRDDAAGSNAVRVLVARLRRKLGDPNSIRSTAAGYQLSSDPEVDLFTLEAARIAASPDVRPVSRDPELPAWMLAREWLQPYLRRYQVVTGEAP